MSLRISFILAKFQFAKNRKDEIAGTALASLYKKKFNFLLCILCVWKLEENVLINFFIFIKSKLK